jgi:hypothetical protein
VSKLPKTLKKETRKKVRAPREMPRLRQKVPVQKMLVQKMPVQKMLVQKTQVQKMLVQRALASRQIQKQAAPKVVKAILTLM